ncbi:MAG: heme exporter protein CcmB [Limnochordales bacterium]|nr:heme exporter protein CcmB [Limnochordales bacterium]
MSFRVLLAVIWQRDSWLARRARAGSLSFLFMSLVILLLLGLVAGPDTLRQSSLLAGLMWTAVAVGSGWSIWQGVQLELEDGAIRGLLHAPVDPGNIFLARTLVQWARTLPPALLLVLLLLFLLGDGWPPGPFTLVASVALGLLGVTAAGILLAYLAVHARGREQLFPLVFLPLAAPVLVAGTELARTALTTGSLLHTGPWWRLLVVYDGVMLAFGWLIFGALVEEG